MWTHLPWAELHFSPNAADTVLANMLFTVGVVQNTDWEKKLPEELQSESFIWQKKERYIQWKGDTEFFTEIFIAREETSTF